MADKVEKPKKQKAKAKKDEAGVLAALPSTRPERIGTRRGAAKPTATAKPAAAAKPARAKPAAAAKPTAAKPRAAAAKAPAKPRATAAANAPAKPRAAAAKAPAKPRATAARRKAAAPRTFEPTEAAETAAGAADERAAGAVPRAETPPPTRPQPVREGAPGIGTTEQRDEPSRPGGTELAATAAKAAVEVAQLGVTIGGEVLKRVIKRLPRP